VATELVVENMLQLLGCRPLPGKVRKQCLFCLSVYVTLLALLE